MRPIERSDEELVVVKIPSGELKICPLEIFPDGIKEGDRVSVEIVDKSL